MRWDLFCQVIDNHGDAGVCWRLAAELAARGHGVRLWIDDPSPLQWMAPLGHPGVEVVRWSATPPDLPPGDAAIEAFGCDPPLSFVARLAEATRSRGAQPPWLNLEYLSAEGYVARSHGLPSPVSHGPGAGLTKHFFYPGFNDRTGGVLREQDLAQRQSAFDRAGWLHAHGVDPARRAISLFCYEPPRLGELLQQLAASATPTSLLVTAGRATTAASRTITALDQDHPGWNTAGLLRLHWLPLLSQPEYDRLLWACDLNFVRGEDSLVRGLLAPAPCVWQLYPQHDDAHHAKLAAFLDWLQPPQELRAFFQGWNGIGNGPLPSTDLAGWAAHGREKQARALALPELAAGLERFVREHARI